MPYVLTIGTEEIEIDTDEEFDVSDLSAAMDRVAAQLSRYSQLWGEAEQEREIADARYRAWVAQYGKELREEDPKAAEWKIKQEVESHPNFLKYKEAIAATIRNCTVLRGQCDALRVKAAILQSKGALMRAELDSTGMVTRSSAGGGGPKDEGERADAVRAKMRAKKAKAKSRVIEDDEDDE